MDITIDYLERKFDEFNNQIFKGELPKIPLKISDVKGFIGLCSYKTKFGDDRNTLVPYDFSISINSRLDLPENEIEDTIIHEMIHYYVGYKQLEDASAHGPLFKTMMNLINEQFGRHITISHKCTDDEEEQSIDTSRRWHIIACVEQADGKFGVKVLPRIIEKIIAFNNKVMASGKVSKIELFMTDEPYFNRFPTSAAAYVTFVDKEEISKYLTDARHLTIEGNEIIEW